MAILSDAEITDYANNFGMIRPFAKKLLRTRPVQLSNSLIIEEVPAISYGLSSYGYDICLSPNDFRIFHRIPGQIVDPKNFSASNLEPLSLQYSNNGAYFILPAHSYGLGVALEHLDIPPDITVLCIGKSTYARCGVIANLTPAEAGWRGHLTLEFSNSSSSDCRIYANEGVVQLLFFKGSPCETSYQDRSGKYQDQAHEVTLARA